MRNGQNNNNKRMRNNNRSNNNNSNSNNSHNQRRNQNPMTRVFDSNGPDIKIRGTASHVAEKYVQLARDARSSGDPVAAENYYQHAEHYFRLIAAAQEQFRQNQQQPRTDSNTETTDVQDEGDSDGYSNFGAEPGFAPQQSQPFQPQQQQREQPYQQQPRENLNRDHQPRERNEHRAIPQNQPQPMMQPSDGGDVDRLPSFITGGAPASGNSGFEANGLPADGERPERNERFPRRRRRPGPRPEGGPAAAAAGDDFNRGE